MTSNEIPTCAAVEKEDARHVDEEEGDKVVAPIPQSSDASTATSELTANEPVSFFLQIYVKHSIAVVLLHLVFALLCAVFALPYFDLSQPDAGLRLRDHIAANLGDAFFAAAAVMVPEGFGSGIVGNSVQSSFKQRTQSGQALMLYWYTDNLTDSVLKREYVSVMKDLENAIFNTSTYQNVLCRLDSVTNACIAPHSPTNLLINSTADTDVEAIADLFHQDQSFFPYSVASPDMPIRFTRVQFHIGAPLPNFTSVDDRSTEQQDLVYETLKQEILPLISAAVARNSQSPIKLTYYHSRTRYFEATNVLMGDLTFAALSVSVVFVSLLFHFFSLVLALGAIIQVLISFPIALFFYRLLLGAQLFGGMHVISIFLILGIGIDDCFVLFDAYDQVTRQFPKMPLDVRLQKSYKIARYSMLATTMTTFFCFLSLVACPIPILKWFGVFCSLLIVINYLLCITLFLGIICIYDKYVHRSDKQREKVSFGERMLVFVVSETIIRHAWRRNVLLVGSAALIGVLTGFAVQLKPSKSLDSFYPAGHPFYEYEEVISAGFKGDVGRFAKVKFLNGLKAPFRDNFDFTNDGDFGSAIFDPKFQLGSPEVQLFLTSQCDFIKLRLANNTNLYSTQEANCPMNDFRDWLQAKSVEFPIMNKTQFDYRLLEFLLQPNNAQFQYGFEPSVENAPYKARYYFNQFPISRSQRLESYEDRVRIWHEWEQFAVQGKDAAPEALGEDGSTHAVDGHYEVWMQTQSILLYNSITSISFSIAVAFAVLFVASYGDLAVALSGTITMASSVACTLGTMQLLGWSLGAVEAVSATIVCGIAVDYNIHLSIAFGESVAASQVDRVEKALRSMGTSVFYGATTTFCASAFLLLCTISILNRFGQFMMMVVAYALTFAVFTQMALLSLEFTRKKPLLKSTLDRLLSIPERFTGTYALWRNLYVVFLLAWIALVFAVGFTYHDAAMTTVTVAPELAALPQQSIDASDIQAFVSGKWTKIQLDNVQGSGCAEPGSKYSFFVYHNANSGDDNVVVEFEGRGQAFCYSAQTCAQSKSKFSTAIDHRRFQRINSNVERFPFTLKVEPKVHVFLPYCTGDAFLGNRTTRYNEFVTLQHAGQVNTQAALGFVRRIAPATSNVVLQGCGMGAVAAMAHSSEFAGNVAVIADSMVLVDEIQAMAHESWGSNLAPFSYASVNATLQPGRLLVVSTAYDWFQSALHTGGSRREFKLLVESTPTAFPFVLRVNGDQHCTVLNPLGERLGMNSKLESVVKAIYSGQSVTNPNELYFKCAADCELDADLRLG